MKTLLKMNSLLLLLFVCACKAQDSGFPEGFTFGAGSAAYSIEGAWDEDGKGESIWDRLTHADNPCYLDDCSNGDVAADAYHKTDEDVQLLSDIGVNHYRFSLSWSRILPTGQVNNINQEGVDYYNGLIDALIADGITPYVAIYHWDLPQALQELGGWTNPILANYYVEYANLAFSLFGDRVQNWITFSDPFQICINGYSYGVLAPGYAQNGVGGLLCAYTFLISHARAYRLYDETYRDSQGGRVGVSFDSPYYVPEDPDNADDVAAAAIWTEMGLGVFTHAIFTEEGNFSEDVIRIAAEKSAEEGFPNSRLPTLTEEEVELIRGSADFFGLDHSSYLVCRALNEDDDVAIPSHQNDLDALCYVPEDSNVIAPEGLRSLLNYINDNYVDVEILILGNGYADDGTISDCDRINYMNQFLEAVSASINEDGINVGGYTVRSLLDGFEWDSGYSAKFGLVNVDFDDDDRPRTRKMSSYVYQNIIETGAVDWDYTPDGFDACDFSRK